MPDGAAVALPPGAAVQLRREQGGGHPTHPVLVGSFGISGPGIPSRAEIAARIATRSSHGYSTVPKHILCSCALPQAITTSPDFAAFTAKAIAWPRSAMRQNV